MTRRRILFTAQPASGHLRPLVPVAHAALRRGHAVAVAANRRLAGEISAYGLEPIAAGYDFAPDTVALLPRHYMRLPFAAAADALAAMGPAVTRLFAGRVADRTAAELLRVAQSWRPDAIVRETDEFGGYLAAEALGIPHACVASFGGLSEYTGQRLAPILGDGRARLGLPADPEGETLYRHLTVSFLPEEFSAAEHSLPSTRCYQHAHSERRGDRLPAWLAGLDHGRPFVFAGFGTVVYDLPGADAFVRAVIAALGQLDATCVVAVGSGGDVSRYPAPPPNVFLVDFVAQPLMLEGCDLFVTHGGLNSLKEAFRLGVPLVITPVLHDQRVNAANCARLGLARVVGVADATADALREACRAVLTDGSYRASARRLQRRIHALPPLDDLIDDLEGLIR